MQTIPNKTKRLRGGTCAYCNRRVFAGNSPEAKANPACRATRDHIEPKILGVHGPQHQNIVVACAECNSVKGHYPLEPFLFFLNAHKGTPRFNMGEFRRFIYDLTLAGFVAAKAVAESHRRAA